MTTSSTPIEKVPSPDRITKTVAAAAAGNALEWFDFSSYAFFAAYISANFFAQGDSISGLTSAYLVFAVGFIARPLGAIILGAYGDRYGRKATLMLTVSLMAVGTFIIGFAPPVWAIGAGAPLLLLVGRLFQGFSAGGEIGGAAAYLVEKAPVEKQATLTGWLQGSMGIANALSALIGFAVTTAFPKETVTAWAWRIPFIIGLCIIPVAVYIRSHLSESEEFLDEMAKRENTGERHSIWAPVGNLIRHYPKLLLIGALMAILWQVCVYALVIYAPTYYQLPAAGLKFSAQDAFLASLVGNLFMIVACPLAGRLGDRYGVARMLWISIGVLIVVPTLALIVLHQARSLGMLIAVHIVMCLCVSFFSGIIASALSRMFPVEIRSTGLSFSYNIGAILFAGFTPAIMTWAVQYTQLATGIYVALAGLVAAATMPAFIRLIQQQPDGRAYLVPKGDGVTAPVAA